MIMRIVEIARRKAILRCDIRFCERVTKPLIDLAEELILSLAVCQEEVDLRGDSYNIELHDGTGLIDRQTITVPIPNP